MQQPQSSNMSSALKLILFIMIGAQIAVNEHIDIILSENSGLVECGRPAPSHVPILLVKSKHLYIHYKDWSKSSRPDKRLAATLTFTHGTSIPISYWRLLTELHAVLHRLSNIKHTLIRRGVCHLDQIEKVEIRPVMKYFCKKEMSPKAINEHFMDTLVKESPFYSTVKKGWRI
jgi:hypothetical protein